MFYYYYYYLFIYLFSLFSRTDAEGKRFQWVSPNQVKAQYIWTLKSGLIQHWVRCKAGSVQNICRLNPVRLTWSDLFIKSVGFNWFCLKEDDNWLKCRKFQIITRPHNICFLLFLFFLFFFFASIFSFITLYHLFLKYKKNRPSILTNHIYIYIYKRRRKKNKIQNFFQNAIFAWLL